MRSRRWLIGTAVSVLLVAAIMPLSALQLRQAAEPPQQLLGTWRLNTAKSKYSPGPAPRSETRVYARKEDGVHGTVDRVHADGRVEKFEYTANFGKDLMVTGIAEYDSVTLRKVDDLTSDATLSHAGVVYGVARRSISPDGKSMTITFDRSSSESRIHNVAVYDKLSE